MRRRFETGVLVERVGDHYFILVPHSGEVHKLSSDFRGVVEALLAGQNTSQFGDHILALDELGLLQDNEKPSPTRRRVLSGLVGAIGVGVVTVALPSAAVASSPTFFVNDTTFFWLDSVDREGFDVGNLNPLDPKIFAIGSLWSLTVSAGSLTFKETANVIVGGDGEAFLLFSLEGERLTPGRRLSGRLSGPRGQQSNVFRISELL